MGPPLKIEILKSVFLHTREDQKRRSEPNFHEPRIGYQIADICVDNQRANFSTGPWDPPLKIKILKIVFLRARDDRKIDPEPNFHEPRSSKC